MSDIESKWTLKKELTDCGFNWESNWRIFDGERVITDVEDDILKKLSCYKNRGWGGGVPGIVAEDDKNIYFVTEYDGATSYASIYKNFDNFIKNKEVPII